MSMGYGANYADVIDEKHIAELCPKEYQDMLDILEDCGLDFEEYAQACVYSDNEILEDVINEMDDYDDDQIEEIIERIDNCWKVLCEKFEKVTTVGNSFLQLNIGYHDSENDGDRYDDVDGMYFYVTGAYELSEAGRIHQTMFERKMFVTFG